jgi:hypothetical protein
MGLVRPEGICKLVEYNYPIGSATRDLPAYNIVTQPHCYRVPPVQDIQMELYQFAETFLVTLKPQEWIVYAREWVLWGICCRC